MNRSPSRTALILTTLTCLPTVLHATIYTNGFESGANPTGWAFIRGGDILESSGGNPGWWLHQPVYDTFAPSVESFFDPLTPFGGDYRDRGVTRIFFDARTDAVDFGDGSGFEMTLLLRNTHGTPLNFDDDDYAYFVGPNVPREGEGWVSYDFAVPSQFGGAVPPGWKGGWSGDCENFRPGVDWGDVITSVDRVELLWLDPCFAAIFQQWNVGVDNLSIEYVNPSDVGDLPIASLELSTFPNPTSGSTTIRLHANDSSTSSQLRVYGPEGRLIRDLSSEATRGSAVLWDGRDASGAMVPSGLYYVVSSSDGRTNSQPITMVR